MIYRPFLECKIILNTPEVVCKFSYVVLANSALIILHNCLEGLRITVVELPTELFQCVRHKLHCLDLLSVGFFHLKPKTYCFCV